MDLYKIADHGEANAMSRFGVWRGRFSLNEKPEHAWQDFRRNADAGVTNAHTRVLGLQLHRQRDFATVRGILRSIHEEICEHLFHSAGVGVQPYGIIRQVDRESMSTPGDV